MIDHRILFISIVIFILFMQWYQNKEKITVGKNNLINSKNSTIDVLQQKLGTPKVDGHDLFWHLPRMYPFYQVRVDSKNQIYICLKITKPTNLNLNLNNINASLDPNTGLLWVIGEDWNDALINLYYVLFDINNEKLMNKTRYVLSINPNFETKLISDIYKKIAEITETNQMDLKPDFTSDLAFENNYELEEQTNYNKNNNDDDILAFNGDVKGSQLDNNWDFLPGDDQKSGNYFMFN
jgi:hypothetical protein